MKWLVQKATMKSSHPAIRRIFDAGYRIEHDLSDSFQAGSGPPRVWLNVRVYQGEILVGSVGFERPGKKLWLRDQPTVLPEHRRKGINTAMYVYAEEVTGYRVADDPCGRSEEAKKF